LIFSKTPFFGAVASAAVPFFDEKSLKYVKEIETF